MYRYLVKKNSAYLLSLVFLCALLPFMLEEFHLSIVIFLLIDLILVTSFRLITTMGLWSCAHIPLMSVGGYTSGLLVIKLGWPFWFSLPIAISVTAVVSFLIGLPCLKVMGYQFFIASYAAGEAIRWIYIMFRNPFGSYAGIGIVPRPDSLIGITFHTTIAYYFLVLFFCVLSLAILYRLENCRIGTTVKAIAENSDICRAVGINVYGYKVLIFIISSSFAGVAGVLFSHFTGTASPADYTFVYGINILILTIVGGPEIFAGPIIGAASLTILREILRDLLEYLPLIYGVVLIVVVLTLPNGLSGLREWFLVLSNKIIIFKKRSL